MTAATLLSLDLASASLVDPGSEVFQRLADLTRPASQKHFPGGAASASIQSLQDQEPPSSSEAGGVRWKVVPQEVEKLGDGKLNQPNFGIVSVGNADKLAQAGRPGGGGGGGGGGVTNPDSAFRGSSFTPFNPPSLPLAVRSPYLNAWLPSGSYKSATPPNSVGNGGYLSGQWASFWTSSYGADGEYRLGWTGYIRIDGKTYQWMGNGFGTLVAEGESAQQLSAEYTATRTIFNFSAGGVKFTVTFFTPITPDDYLRQSLPLSYMHFELDRKSSKGKSVQMYTDIDERWVTGHDYDYEDYPYDEVFETKGNSSIFFVSRKRPQVYTEFRQRAEWGNATYAARSHPGLTSRNNNNIVTQKEFLDRGKLTIDHGPVLGPDNSFAFAVDFDAKGASSDALFVVGHMRSPYVNYIRKVGGPDSNSTRSYQEDRYGYWMSKYPRLSDAVSFFMDDFESALAKGIKFDQQIVEDSKRVVGGGKVGDQYAAITQLSVRQAFATFEITVPLNSTTRKYDTDDTLIFLKEISSNGDMSTVDVIFPLFPLLSYTNPRLLRDILLPIFEYTESGLYPNKWCVHDLGVYPNAFGHNDGNDEPMQVEESGNMIWMTLHWAQLVGKKESVGFLQSHYAIMKQWAEFLVEDSLIPATQLSTDDFAGTLANQTNLAIKGIEGIAAIGKIASLIGKQEDAQRYSNISSTYIKLWQKYATSKDGSHTKLSYQDDSSWGTLYNLFGDRILNLGLVPTQVYDTQDAWYRQVVQEWALPLDSRHKWSKTDWQMFAAATSRSNKTRDLLIALLHKFASNGRTDAPLTDLMESTTGDFPKQPDDPLIYFLARPVVGGHFSFLALDKADRANGVVADHSEVPLAPVSAGRASQKAFGLVDRLERRSVRRSPS
ncbi:putative glutaminase A [Violaceomyces palustris]|uniref:Glutaminase A n=1 Tax=Violaceomyces palustris TaxID=1673888 RepID=A0ACD0NRN4_9BASI|nr:putative glutaminase A [Violaceomyces palustris]